MAKIIKKKTICKKCLNEFEITLAESLNSLYDQDCIERILSGSEHVCECPKCGSKSFVRHNLIYTDIKNNFKVCYVETLQDAYEIIQKHEENLCFEDDCIYRVVVGNYPRFMEKVSILSAGFNDLAIEFYKIMVRADLELSDDLDVFMSFNDDLSEYCISTVDEKFKECKEYMFNKKAYDYILGILKNEDYYNRKNDYFVDKYFIEQLIENKNENEPLHLEIFREREFIAFVEINELQKEVLCIGSNNKVNQKVKVMIENKIYKGIIRKIKLLSEKRLGKTFDEIPRIV